MTVKDEQINPFAGLPKDQREQLLDALDRAVAQRKEAKQLALAWLRIAWAFTEFVARVKLFQAPIPTVGDLPSKADALAYALASETLTNEEFNSYIGLMDHQYWGSDAERADIIETTHNLWSLPEIALTSLAPEWIRHLLRNAPSGHEIAPPSASDSPEMLLETIGEGRRQILYVDTLGPVAGVLFTGPRLTSIVLCRMDEKGHEQITMAHLIAHFVLGHINRTRFGTWVEYRPGQTPALLREDVDYWCDEEEADDAAVCLLEPRAREQGLTDVGRRLLVGARQLGIPKPVILALIHWRNAGGVPIVSQLWSRDPRPGDLVYGSERHVYFIDRDYRKHWVCSKRLLRAADATKSAQRVPDDILDSLGEGAPIYDLETAAEIGLSRPGRGAPRNM